MSKVNFVFFGTPQLSADILEHLKRHDLVPSLVVTNPDRPQGRKMALTPPPVKVWAQENKIPCLQPENPSDPEFVSQVAEMNSRLFVVVAYGSILSEKLLNVPEKGSLNVHYSLLPKYRGASPIESQILEDDKDTGVSILLLDEEMDHGPIVAQRNLQLTTDNKQQRWPPKASELRNAMNAIAGKLLTDVIPKWTEGEMEAQPQDHTQATYTKKFTKSDGEISLSDNPYKNFLKIQAFDDSIGTYFFTEKDGEKTRVIIKGSEYKNGELTIIRVIPEGKKEMSYAEFLRGVR